jgi:hypothetical protein
MTPTAWDFRNKLMAILNLAKHSGEPYVDVDSSHLHAELGGDPNAIHKMPICHDLMKRIMRPGDLILKESQNGNGPTMLIRYNLKANHDN